MRFFDRKEEIASLQEIGRQARENAQFTVVTGRRRIGKTMLVRKAYEKNRCCISLSPEKQKETCARITDLR